MSDKFSDFDFDEFNETFSGADDSSTRFSEGKHMRDELPHAPKHAGKEDYGYDLDNFDEQEKTKVYPSVKEPVREPSSDYGDDFYSRSAVEEDEDDRTMIFDKAESEQLSSDMRAGRQQRELRELEKDKKKNGALIAIIIITAVILVGLIIFLAIFLTGGKGKKAETTPTATAATQVTTEKATQPTQAPKTEAPKPTQAPKTEAPKPTEAPVTPTEAPVTPTEAPVTPTDAPDISNPDSGDDTPSADADDSVPDDAETP